MATAGWLAPAVAVAGVVAAFDPKVQPTRASFWPFLFVAVMLTLLMFSMVRHLRRARENLGPAEPAGDPGFPEIPRPDGRASTRDGDEPVVPDQQR